MGSSMNLSRSSPSSSTSFPSSLRRCKSQTLRSKQRPAGPFQRKLIASFIGLFRFNDWFCGQSDEMFHSYVDRMLTLIIDPDKIVQKSALSNF